MKYLLIFFVFSIASAQSIDVGRHGDSIKSSLSQFELQIAKDKYLKMMQSETYITVNENLRILNKNLKGVQLFDISEASWIKDIDGFRKALRESLFKDIEKTDFTSLDEAVDTIVDNFVLTQKMIEENSELYKLMSIATKNQIAQIMEPERENPYDILFNYRNND